MVPTPTPTLPIRLALEAKASAAAIGMLGSAHPQGKAKLPNASQLTNTRVVPSFVWSSISLLTVSCEHCRFMQLRAWYAQL